ncbi:membrane protein [Bacillus sp. SA1-12]|uniref:energy-coupling factor transporter transmembrane component T family protein n=1 Tax=Bacillus sp. SA1-12 TaxID=1455638 RepID=UPI00062746A3|nr:energy-coupling factor transporter transmembrane component T [Bacillus sp. SA1-12]KKI89028.1 membrane protein [Bacillus sp. SA1-12]
MAVNMLSFIDRESPVHRLTGATKLICFLFWSTAAMLTYDTRILLFLLFISFFLFLVSKIKFSEISFVLGFILFFLFINNVAIYIFSPQEGVGIYGSKHLLVELPKGYELTLEQLFYQFNLTLKYITVIPAALILILTTNPSEFAASLNKIGISYRIAFAVSLTLRYIPDLQRDFRNIARSQQARGLDMSKKEKLPARMRNALSIIMPLIFSSLDRIEAISNVMELRGFGKKDKRTWYSARPFTKNDYLALCLIGVISSISLIVTFFDGNRFYNPF